MSNMISLHLANSGPDCLPISLRTPQPSGFCDGYERQDIFPIAPAGDSAKLIAENLPLVRALARQLHTRLPRHIEFEELVSAGVLGLVDAADRFRDGQQAQFTTYAHFRIRGAMLDLLRSTDWSPRIVRRQARMIERAVQVLAAKGVQSPSDVEIATELGLPQDSYHQLLADLKRVEMGSLHVERHEESGEQNIQQVPGPASDDPLFRCLEGEIREGLLEAIETLPEKERLVLSLYYHEELTMREVAQVLGVGESRISQMHSSAVTRLRSALQEGTKPGSGKRLVTAKPSQSPSVRK